MTHPWIHNEQTTKEIADLSQQINEIKQVLTNTSELAMLTGKAVEDLIYELTDEQSVNPSSVWLLISKLPQQSSQLLAMNQRLALRIDELSRQGNKQEIVIALLKVKLAVLTDDVIALHNLPQNNGYIAP